MSHSVGGLGPGLSLWKPPPHTDNSCTGSPVPVFTGRVVHDMNLRSFIHAPLGILGCEGLCKVSICASSLLMHPCYTTPLLTSLLPFLFPLIGRGAQTDSGEPLLWQLPPKRRTQGQPDICQRPPQSNRAWQKPIRWDAAAAGFQGRGAGVCG